MADETKENPGEGAAAVEQAAVPVTEQVTEAATEQADKPAEKLNQTVEIKDIGPCKKHLKVTVSRTDIDGRIDEKYKELVGDAQVPGFRPGKAPRKIVVRHFEKEVSEQVKSQVLLASLEQLAEEHDIAPLSPPNINPNSLVIPAKGDFVYEFDVEVRPQFDLPNYKGLKLKKPVYQFSAEDLGREEERILGRFGQLVPKPEGNAQKGEYLICDMTTRQQERVIGQSKEISLQIDDTLAFKDGVAEKFAEQTVGASAGETRTVDITMSDAVADQSLRGQTVQAVLEIKDVKKMRLPELTHEFLHNFGMHTPEQFKEWVRLLLDRRLEYQQRQSAREQVLQHIAASADWDLPEDMLMRQARKTMARKVMEMQEAGLSENEIAARQRMMQRDVLRSTALALKEHFVLQKIAEVEKIEVDDDDIEAEVERIADQNNQSARRVRAQLEKEDLLETLAAQLIERKALDLILESAEYEEVSLGKEGGVAAVEQQAVPGEIKDPTAVPPEAQEEASAEGPATP